MIIIEDMELPTGCDVCPCCQSNAHFTNYTCGVTGEDATDECTGEIFTDRPWFCPMKEYNT